MRNILRKIIFSLSKPFIGSGISEKLPFIQSVFRYIYPKLTKEEFAEANIPLDIVIKYSTKDAGLGAYLAITGEYETEETEFVIQNLHKGDTFVDIGANIGYFTTLASKIVEEEGKVWAFEPVLSACNILNENLKKNSLGFNTTIEQKAVGDKSDTISISESEIVGHSSISDSKNLQDVEMTTLDSYVNQHNITRIDILKIDIEGAELMALNGMKKILEQKLVSKIMIEINPITLEKLGVKWNEIFILLNSYFDLFIDHSLSIAASEDSIKNSLQDSLYINLYGVSKG
jgi:FkbM family methyltransferase